MRWLVLGLLFLSVATCGQKGPLTVPDEVVITNILSLASSNLNVA